MHQIDEPLEVVDGRLGQQGAARAKDVTRLLHGRRLVQNSGCLLLDELPRSQEQGWIQVSLDAFVKADGVPRIIDGDAPIDADDVVAVSRTLASR